MKSKTFTCSEHCFSEHPVLVSFVTALIHFSLFSSLPLYCPCLLLALFATLEVEWREGLCEVSASTVILRCVLGLLCFLF